MSCYLSQGVAAEGARMATVLPPAFETFEALLSLFGLPIFLGLDDGDPARTINCAAKLWLEDYTVVGVGDGTHSRALSATSTEAKRATLRARRELRLRLGLKPGPCDYGPTPDLALPLCR